MTLTIGSIFRSRANPAETLLTDDSRAVNRPRLSRLPDGSILPNMSLPRGLLTRTPAAALLAVAICFAAQAQQAPPGPTGKVYVVTHVDIIGGAEGTAEAIKAMHDLQVASLREPGAIRFEVLQQDSRLNHFVMLEVWQNRQAYDAHNAMDHTLKFRATIAPILGSPFDVRLHRILP